MTIKASYDNAELAFGAYANLDDSLSTVDQSNIDSLVTTGMSRKQAEQFAARYPEVIEQYKDSTTGFSATIFRAANNQLTLAIRGTDDLSLNNDGDDDLNISVVGAATEQIISLYEWWEMVSATEPLVSQLSFDAKIDVTGHSLGGHLAMAFGSLFPSQVRKIYTFNAPGFKDELWNQQFFDGLVPGATVPTGTNTTNIIADEASIGDAPWSAIAGLHSRPGVAVDIAIEDQWLSDEFEPESILSGANHSIKILTDALAVYSLLYQLDTTLDEGEFKSLLNSSVVGSAGSYEGVVDSLQKLFGISTDPLLVGNNHRNDLYIAIYNLKNDANFVDKVARLRITPLLELDVSSLSVSAEASISYRYALVNLNPFVVVGDDSIYAQHNTNGELDVANFTPDYLKDRSAFLSMVLQRNSEDNTSNYYPADFDITARAYYDALTGTFFYTGSNSPAAGASSHTLVPSFVERFYFGGDIQDRLTGGNNTDHLYGMSGNDTLTGGLGDDLISGGLGNDTYIFNIGDGSDRIIDSVHQSDDTILVNGININSYTFISVSGAVGGYGLYQGIHASSAAPDVTLFYNGSGLRIDINDGVSGNHVIVDYFIDGDFGIVLDEAELISPPDTDLTVGNLNTTSPSAFIRESSSENGIPWANVNLRFEAATATGYSDGGFYGTAGGSFEGGRNEDYLTGTTGSNALAGFGGNDIIEGLAGNDYLTGGAGADTISGADGNDLIWGSAGPDFNSYLDDIATDPDLIHGAAMAAYYSGQYTDTLNDLNTLDGGAGDDMITGGEYRDVIKGGAGFNYLLGNTGNDLIAGGSDHDVIYGDSAFDFRINDNGSLDPIDWEPLYAIAFADGANSVNSYDDIIDAGAGDDTVWGELGDDIIQGGEGNDSLYGDRVNDGSYFSNEFSAYGSTTPELLESLHGNDNLDGGSGDDFLYGNGGDDSLMGGLGTDILDGGTGNDTYIFRGGDGYDTLLDASGDIRLVFELIDFSHLVIQYQGDLASISYMAPDSSSWDSVVMLKTAFERASIAGFNSLNMIDQIYRDDKGNVQFTVAGNPDAALGSVGEQLQYSIAQDGTGGFALNFDNSVNTLDISESAGVVTIASADFRFMGIEVAPGVYESVSISGQSPQFYIRTMGSENNDVLTGSSNSDTLLGFAGVDTLYGYGDDDTLVGGAGNDFLYGGSGQDNYLFSLGDGQDIVGDSSSSNYWFDETVTSAEITVVINDLQSNTFSLNYSDVDSIAVTQSNGPGLIGGIYHNGQRIRAVITSSIEDGYLEGTGGADTFIGGTGNDTYAVNSADDDYQFSTGDGQDLIQLSDGGEKGTIRFSTDVDPATVSFVFGGTATAESWIYYGNGDAIKLDQALLNGNNLFDNPFTYFDIVFEADPTASLLIENYSSSNGAVYGSNGSDIITGTDDYNRIMPGKGFDVIDAKGGDDMIVLTGVISGAYSGVKDITGGQGNDQVEASLFQGVTYRYNPGDGFDAISYEFSTGGQDYNWERSPTGVPLALIPAGEDVIVFGEGISQADLELSRNQDALDITLKDGSGGISITSFFTVYDAADAGLEQDHPDWWYEEMNNILEDPYLLQLLPKALVASIYFTDGGLLDIEAYISANPDDFVYSPIIYGSDDPQTPDFFDNFGTTEGLTYFLLAGDDGVDAGDGDDVIYGGEGNDIIVGEWGDDDLFGEAGNDILVGELGNDLLVGGEGDDELYGWGGDDTYQFSSGFGKDVLHLENQSAGDSVSLFFTSDIAETSVLGDRVGDDLVLSVVNDSIRMIDYYLLNNSIDQVIFAGGNSWDTARLTDSTSRYDSNGNQVRSATASGNTYAAFDEANRQIFSIDEAGIVKEYRYDANGTIIDRITYSDSVASYLAQWVIDNPGEAAPSASDISGMFADMAQDNGEYHRQLLANGDAHYALDAQQWNGDATWLVATESGDRRLQGVVAQGNTASSAINQQINLSAYASDIDVGNGNLVLTVGGSDLSPNNISSRWLVSFTDSNGDAIGTTATSTMNAGSSWADHEFDVGVPFGARFAQLTLSTYVPSSKLGTTAVAVNTPVYFDNLRVDAHIAGTVDDFVAEPSMSSRVTYNDTLFATEDAVANLNETDLLLQVGVTGDVAVEFDSVSNGDHGTVSHDEATGAVTFTPADGFVGQANFFYSVLEEGIPRSIKVSVMVKDSIFEGTAGQDGFGGTAAADDIYGYAGNDFLRGAGKSDLIRGGDGNDIVVGDDGSDTLYGEFGNDYIVGGPGNDRLAGGEGSDIYFYSEGNDQGDDVIDNSTSSWASDNDKLNLYGLAAKEDVWFSRSGDNLLVEFVGLDGSITINNWYSDPDSRVDEIYKSSDSLYASDIEILVQAMSAFVPPVGSGSVFNLAQEPELQNAVASAWTVN